ncbi:MAG: hypothetical protein KBC46_02185 [Ferrovibrio sp.]|nr:hypothetical protein [Ferrovibrio sp.]
MRFSLGRQFREAGVRAGRRGGGVKTVLQKWDLQKWDTGPFTKWDARLRGHDKENK